MERLENEKFKPVINVKGVMNLERKFFTITTKLPD